MTNVIKSKPPKADPKAKPPENHHQVKSEQTPAEHSTESYGKSSDHARTQTKG